jgi:gas vesicle protein
MFPGLILLKFKFLFMQRMLTFVLIGIAIGVLIAPDKGSLTRSRLSDMLSDFSEDVKDQADNLLGKVKDTMGDLESEVY